MNHNLFPRAASWLALSFVFVIAFVLNSTAVAQDVEPVDFVKQIQPIFEMHCVRCHGEEEAENMRIDQRDSAFDYIEAGDAENSALFEHLTSDEEDVQMPPPDEEDPLSIEQIQLVTRWINEGATWPEGLELTDRYAETPTDDSEGDEKQGTATTSDEQESNDQQGNAQGDTKDETKGTDQGNGEAAASEAKTSEAKTKRVNPLGRLPKPKKNEVDGDTPYWAIGSLHPAAVHLPIGLLLAAGFFGFLGLRGNFVMSDCAYYCLWLGTFGCIAACVSGWWASPLGKMGTVEQVSDLWNMDQRVFWHRTWGLAIAVVSMILALFAARARSRDPDEGVMWKLGAILLAVGVSWTGHLGGELSHGSSHYKHIEALYNSFFAEDKNSEQGESSGLEDEAQNADATGAYKEDPSLSPPVDADGNPNSNIGLGFER